MARFILLSRDGCHLCEEMEALLREELPKYGESFSVDDVDSDLEWRQRYGTVIPVLLRDGSPVAKVRLDSRQLSRIVQGNRSASPSTQDR